MRRFFQRSNGMELVPFIAQLSRQILDQAGPILRTLGYQFEFNKQLNQLKANRIRGLFLAKQVDWNKVIEKLGTYSVEYEGHFLS
jgi:hypothetical protein